MGLWNNRFSLITISVSCINHYEIYLSIPQDMASVMNYRRKQLLKHHPQWKRWFSSLNVPKHKINMGSQLAIDFSLKASLQELVSNWNVLGRVQKNSKRVVKNNWLSECTLTLYSLKELTPPLYVCVWGRTQLEPR